MKTRNKFIVTFVVLVMMVGTFTLGVQASTWMNYTGDTTKIETEVDEIMEILRKVHEDKLSVEKALEELEGMNPPGLVEKIKKLEKEIDKLKEENAVLVTDNASLNNQIDHLEAELTRANEEVQQLSTNTSEALDEARELVDEARENE